MATYERNRCKNCGAPLDLTRAKGNVVKCEYCGECFILPKDGAGEKVCSFLAIGEHCLDTADFTGAYTAYEKAAQLHQEEPEAYFGMALATAKVQYLQDVVNNRLQPICHEIAKKKVTKDKNYQKAIALATAEQKAEYEKRAREIDEIREKFYEFRHAGLDYDCFLCVKVTGEDGKHTEDSFIASKIYKELKKEGYAPFYSEEEIGERTGSDYEALILYALYTAECMLAVCSDEEYLLTPWVKNEYTRFLRLLSDEEKERDSFAFVFDGTPVERIPGRHGKVQGINFKDGTAMKKIEKFVAVHTPEAKKRREEEAKRKAEEEERKNRIWEEMAQRLRKYEEAEEAAKRADEERRVAEQHKAEEIAAAEAKKHAEEEKRIAEEFEIEDGVLVEYYGEGGEVIIPDGVTEIGNRAFKGCGSLTGVTIPDGITEIGWWAFDGCSSLKEIRIPVGVREIDSSAFADCGALLQIIVNEQNENFQSKGNCLLTKDGKILIRGCNNSIIPDSVTSIGDWAFNGCDSLTSITMPDGVTEIGESAFASCSSLTTVTIPDSVSKIGEGAFKGCSSLTSMTIPESVTSIGYGAFYGCNELTVYCNEAQAELVEQTGGAWEKEWDNTKKCYKLRYIK